MSRMVSSAERWTSRVAASAGRAGRATGRKHRLLSARTSCRAAAYLNNRLQGMRGRACFSGKGTLARRPRTPDPCFVRRTQLVSDVELPIEAHYRSSPVVSEHGFLRR